MDTVMVIPFRADAEGYRRRNLEFILKYYAAKRLCDIVVVEQSQRPTDLALQGARHIHLEDGGAFNRSRCRNAGARASAEQPWIIWSDGDVIHPRVEAHLAAHAAPAAPPTFINPKNALLDLSERQTQQLMHTGHIEGSFQCRRSICGASGMCILNRQAFDLTGGMDERFLGWGGEDDAFDCLCRTLGGITCLALDDPLLHLWHPREPDLPIYDPQQYRKNLAMVHDCQRDVRKYQRDRGIVAP